MLHMWERTKRLKKRCMGLVMKRAASAAAASRCGVVQGRRAHRRIEEFKDNKHIYFLFAQLFRGRVLLLVKVFDDALLELRGDLLARFQRSLLLARGGGGDGEGGLGCNYRDIHCSCSGGCGGCGVDLLRGLIGGLLLGQVLFPLAASVAAALRCVGVRERWSYRRAGKFKGYKRAV